jgi:quercetin dioxygenase-like cupin family protein
MPLKISKNEMTAGKGMALLKGGGMATWHVYGAESSMMLAERSAGYHSRPHIHLAEQINYVIEGEIWTFIGEEALHLKAGDFARIPSMAVHWAWNRSDKPCTFIQSFAPVHEIKRPGSVGLFDEGEQEPNESRLSRNYAVSDEYMRIAEEKIAAPKK